MRNSVSGQLALAVIAVAAMLALAIAVVRIHDTGSANITCKKTAQGQHELCVQGQPRPVIVPLSVYQAARVGGWYDTGTGKAYGTSDDDPHVNPPPAQDPHEAPVEDPHIVIVDK